MVRLLDSHRSEFKKPLGLLIKDSEVTSESISKYAGSDAHYITVGDASAERAHELGLSVCLEILDGLEKRVPRSVPKTGDGAHMIKCKNPPGYITKEAAGAVSDALKMIPGQRVRILVDGEEDLLVLSVCANVGDGFAVLYGQPDEGLVVVRTGPDTRNKAKSMLDMLI